ncbi:MAG: hypothetical protein CO065_01090 [Comamonadaceae bacterium CG_4_9_14_0_8_um_filter_57_21]|nr:MAG: hypothetical protein CO065_01090 [Comamonadaceae bacterium CG_4_9_14_0_8_um_filter_57_21]
MSFKKNQPVAPVDSAQAAIKKEEIQELLSLAESWAQAGDSTLIFWPKGELNGVTLLTMPAEKAAFLACAIALRDALLNLRAGRPFNT